jgi:mannose-6-phosphate isomerase-like protein (cupin superfamily)
MQKSTVGAVDRYAAPNATSVLVASPHSGPRRAQRARQILPAGQGRGSAGIRISKASTWLALLAALAPAPTWSQSATPANAAIDITAADIQTVLKHIGKEGVGTDRQIRVVDLGNYHVAVGILHRGAAKDTGSVTALAHAQVTEVYYIVSGSGMLVTGGAILQPKSFPLDGELVKVLVGPTTIGVVQGGHRRPVATGDIVIIPPGVPHGFAEIADHVTYLSIRPDGDRILPAGYVHPALRK